MKRQLTNAEVTHLRKLLAWMRVEYHLDEDMQRGGLRAVRDLHETGLISNEQAVDAINRQAERIQQVPLYVRQAVKMLTKTIREFDGAKDVVNVSARDVQEIE
jgi:hypothetical protein